jgi:hypothetical protein
MKNIKGDCLQCEPTDMLEVLCDFLLLKKPVGQR